jgi:hypothetical protein
MTPEFKPFPKMPRLSRECIITEKIDGTNASILITPGYPDDPKAITCWYDETTQTDMVMYAGSRTRWITPQDDNFGFAKWVRDNADQLAQLGPGHHFGEWWGQGIQRNYGLKEKRFSLFNVQRWRPRRVTEGLVLQSAVEEHPECCDVVPVVYAGLFKTPDVDIGLNFLSRYGSIAAPGFMNPEGVVVFHVAGNVGFKKTIEKDDQPKGLQ